MRTEPMKLLTLIAEPVLEDRLVADLRRLGARGWSVGAVHGEDTRGARTGEWEGGSVRIETLVSDEVADRILERLEKDYFPRFEVVAYVADVRVVRGDRFR